MLSEPDRRRLLGAVDAFLLDFEPRDAAAYFETKGILEEREATAIENEVTRLQRLRLFNRFYSRRAHDLRALEEFFAQNGQKHLGEILTSPVDLPFVSTEASDRQRRHRLLRAKVPPSPTRFVERPPLFDRLLQELASRRESLAYFVVLHGPPGSGKTAEVSAALHNRTDLHPAIFNDILFKRSGDEQLERFAADLVVSLGGADLLDDSQLEVIDSFSAEKLADLARDALIDRPNLLLVIDDLAQQDHVDWLDQLQCRILATTRDSSIFSDTRSTTVLIPVDGFDADHVSRFLSQHDLPPFDQSILHRFTEDFDGNPALLSIIARKSGGVSDTQSHFVDLLDLASTSGLWQPSIRSVYGFTSLGAAWKSAGRRLEESSLDCALSLLTIRENDWKTEDQLLPLVPVDVGENESEQEVRIRARLVISSLRQSGWIESHKLHPTKMRLRPIAAHYLRSGRQRDVKIEEVHQDGGAQAQFQPGFWRSIAKMFAFFIPQLQR